MIGSTTTGRNETGRRVAWAVLVAALSVALMIAGVQTASAQQTGLCSGDLIVVFPNARLLNVDGARTAGPFAVSLSPGTYLVTAGSYDDHGGDQITQPQEQWQMIADSGWRSPFTVDIADDSQTVVSTFNTQVIEAEVTAVTLSHLGQGVVNSVTPVCAGFTKLSDPPEPSTPDTTTPDTTTPDTTTPDTTTPDTTTPDTTTPEPSDPDSSDPDDPDEPDSVTPTTSTTTAPVVTTAPPTTDVPDASDDTDDEDDPEAVTPTTATTVAPVVTTAAPPPETAAPVTSAAPVAPDTDDDTSGGTSDDIEPEVGGVIETPDGVLARTGPTSTTRRLLGLGMFLIGLGGLAVLGTSEARLHLRRA